MLAGIRVGSSEGMQWRVHVCDGARAPAKLDQKMTQDLAGGDGLCGSDEVDGAISDCFAGDGARQLCIELGPDPVGS